MMSEAITAPDTEASANGAPEGQVTQQQAQPAEGGTLAEGQAAEPQKPSQKDRRFAHLTAKLGDASRQRDADAARIKALEELLAARTTDPGAEPPKQQQQTPSQDAVRVEAERLREQERFNERRTALIGEGVKDLGEEAWNEKTSILHEYGATANAAFMQAITELPEGAKIVAALADDVDQLEGLLRKSPAAMAAHLGRMSAQFEAPKKAPLSTAPKPVTPVGGSARAEVDPSKMSMKEYAAYRAKTAPRSLGGHGKKS
jgi:small-conductance mechanosensitive channel